MMFTFRSSCSYHFSLCPISESFSGACRKFQMPSSEWTVLVSDSNGYKIPAPLTGGLPSSDVIRMVNDAKYIIMYLLWQKKSLLAIFIDTTFTLQLALWQCSRRREMSHFRLWRLFNLLKSLFCVRWIPSCNLTEDFVKQVIDLFDVSSPGENSIEKGYFCEQ